MYLYIITTIVGILYIYMSYSIMLLYIMIYDT